MVLNRRHLMLGIMAISLLAREQPMYAQETTILKIGYQLCDPLDFLRNSELIKKFPIQIKWEQFISGPSLVQALLSGAIDIGEVGDTPPVFAQNNSDQFLYIAQEPASFNSEGIIVSSKSSLKNIADLKGKKIAVTRGSNAHWLLLAALKKAELLINDIHIIFLPPAIAQVAFNTHQIDAWAIWDPFLAIAQQNNNVRVLVTGEDLVGNRTFYIGNKNFVLRHPKLVHKFISYLADNDSGIHKNKIQYLQYLKEKTGLSEQTLNRIVSRFNYGATLVKPDAMIEQQKIADIFFNEHLLTRKINILDNIWKG